MLPEKRYGVWLYADRIGTLNQRGDYTWFAFSETYLQSPDRKVLGLIFEQDLHGKHASALRLPPWFSNLLPEGVLRDWVAQDRGVSTEREMELLAQVGHDLPGAVRILAEDGPADELVPALTSPDPLASVPHDVQPGWRFSLAGVGLKFSMVRHGDRLTLPAFGEGGDWIVKFPDPLYRDVPRNEHAMMSLAGAVGIDVPEHALIARDKLDGVPDVAWPTSEEYAYAVRRFDRTDDRRLVHIEDFAQVRNFYSNAKYAGNFETIAAIAYRRRDLRALHEFTKRLTFNILISNGDAHLKNWSLIYLDPRIPTLSPAYDLVATSTYDVGARGDLGLKFNRTSRFDALNIDAFGRLEQKLGAQGADLRKCAAHTVERVVSTWPTVANLLDDCPTLQANIDASISERSKTLLGVKP